MPENFRTITVSHRDEDTRVGLLNKEATIYITWKDGYRVVNTGQIQYR